MNIGIFVTSLNPESASQARFQQALLHGLQELRPNRYHFVICSHEVPQELRDSEHFSYLTISSDRWWVRATRLMRSRIGHILSRCNLAGTFAGPFSTWLTSWPRSEPKYYTQLRDLNVRLLWNMNQHELPTALPFIRTIWDVNHRIHPMYPEYSYTRFTFDGLDHDMAYSLARASYVIVGTEEGKRQVVSIFGVHANKVRVIPFPTPVLSIGDEHSGRASKMSAGTPYIFYPARFWPHKNHVIILAAMKILKDEWNIGLRCIFAGADQGNLAYVLRFAERLGIRDQIEYLGIVPEEELAFLYRGALALVFASSVGPDNLPPLEAMSLGCPVITAEVPGAQEQYGDAALYFESLSERTLAHRIKELFQNDLMREQLIRRGRERAASWTVIDYAEEMISLFDEFAAIARAWEKCDSVFT
jgi:glycosyltransferase involved in cell wall biosynthesis